MYAVFFLEISTYLNKIQYSTSTIFFWIIGIAIDKDGIIYFADGANIRVIDKTKKIRTMIGSQSAPKQWVPFPCDRVVSIDEVKTQKVIFVLSVVPFNDTM